MTAKIDLLARIVEAKRLEALAPEGKLLDFTRYYFPEREGMDLIEGPHHRLICSTLDKVLAGEISRLIINVPPGYSKTESAVVNFMAKGFHVNPAARFIHATFSDDLARENSDKVQSVIALEGYQAVKPVTIRADSKAKDRWRTTDGGGVLAKAAGGPITGFRAGYMDKTCFTGALIVDDPLKPDDAFSPVKRKTVNQRATNTFRSRLAHDGVPIIVIMQRLHDDDFVGHLLKGGTGEKWHHLNLPVWIDRSEPYPVEWTHGIPVEHDLQDGPLWPEKHSVEEIEILKADAYTFASQYMQRPVSIEGALFDMAGFKWYRELPPIDHYMMFADTAQKTGERNDYSVIQLWGKAGGSIYLVDQVRGKWEAPELEKTALAFWAKHKGRNVRGLRVEDKVSGTGLIQTLRRKGVPVTGIKREKDKYTRGLDAAPWVATGMVWLPENADYSTALRAELQMFDGLGTGHDDQCLIAGTMVRTDRGDMPIESIRSGDMVLTRKGFKRVTRAWMSNPSADVVTAEFCNGVKLTGTRDHPVWMHDVGFVPLDAVADADYKAICLEDFPRIRSMQSNLMASRFAVIHSLAASTIGDIILRVGVTLREGWNHIIGSYGSFTKGRSLKDGKSTISTTIRSIMQLITLNAYRLRNTRQSIRQKVSGRGLPALRHIWTGFAQRLRNGIQAMRGAHGTPNKRALSWPQGNRLNTLAQNAGVNSYQKRPEPVGRGACDFAQGSVKRAVSGKTGGTCRTKPARLAVFSSKGHQERKHAHVSALRVSRAGVAAVYNLTVEDCPEFYANGILVHNCDPLMDAIAEMLGSFGVNWDAFE